MKIGEIVVAGCAAAVAACGFVSVRRLKRALREAAARLAAYGAESAVLSYGRMTYVDRMPVDENLGDKKPSDEGSGDKKLEGKELYGKAPNGKRPGEKAAVEALLSVHGLYGGYDQAFENVESFSSRYRIIAPSRFGYLGSSVKGEGTPREQAEAYAELLDRLEIERAFVLGPRRAALPRSASLWTSRSAPRA